MILMLIKIKLYQWKNALMELNLTWHHTWHHKESSSKIQLIIAINFIFFKDTDEQHLMDLKSDHIEIMVYDKPNEVMKKVFFIIS